MAVHFTAPLAPHSGGEGGQAVTGPGAVSPTDSTALTQTSPKQQGLVKQYLYPTGNPSSQEVLHDE